MAYQRKEDRRSLRRDVGTIVGVGVPIETKTDSDPKKGAYPAWVIVADSAQYPASYERYKQDAAILYNFFLQRVPWETWDEFERLSNNRYAATKEGQQEG